ncbi:hypothetical protein [Loktanella sp. 3ANDIMAR09]|uniref:hypothetical protein n=1 Tax=Loktanella sp. 3ANDIMAR09 TaxID=1225657 RepID=UPI00155F158E|nr:hypothetical protein [Loktanella sp. 3ANDIMAR09]
MVNDTGLDIKAAPHSIKTPTPTDMHGMKKKAKEDGQAQQTQRDQPQEHDTWCNDTLPAPVCHNLVENSGSKAAMSRGNA